MVSIYELRLRSLFIDGSASGRRLPDDWLYFDSGRSALYFLLRHLKEEVGIRTVYVNAYTTDVVHRTIRSLDLDVVPMDIDARTLRPRLPDRRDLRHSVTMCTGLFGFPAYDASIASEIRQAGGIFLEDCANSFGAQIGAQESGSLGDAAIFSFRVGKPLSSSGGALRINTPSMVAPLQAKYRRVPCRSRSEELIRHLRTCIDYAVFSPLVLQYISRPLRTLQKHIPALKGLVKGGVVDTVSEVDAESLRTMTRSELRLAHRRFSRWDDERAVRRTVSEQLCELLRSFPLYLYAGNPAIAEGWNYLFFPVLLDRGDPDTFVECLRRSGFDATRFHADVPLLSFPDLRSKDFEGTFRIIEKLVCIPNTTNMAGKEQKLKEAVDRYFSSVGKA
jgi:dTDP-4-amino-4,6-dideoxygalactose transaminase